MKMHHYDINRIVQNNTSNLAQLQDACYNNRIHRIYSGWRYLTSVYDMLKMLGYTISFTSNVDDLNSIEVSHWFGYDVDSDAAQDIIAQLC